MAPAHTSRPDKNKKIKSLLSFSFDLEAQLPTASSAGAPQPIAALIERQIHTFPSNLGRSAPSDGEELDRAGSTLWNLCTRLRRGYDDDKIQSMPIILLLARAFAFLLLDLANTCGKSTKDNVFRLMRIGIKAAKNCIESDNPGLALKVLERIGVYEASLKNFDSAEIRARFERLIAEYYVLRTALAWQQDQLDVAEHMYKKSMTSKEYFDAYTVECLADVLYEMGKDHLGKKQYSLAAMWLNRAHEVLTGKERDRLSFDASELRISIIESSIKALLGFKAPESLQTAQSLVTLLQNELGDKLIVLLLRLELLSTETGENFDSNAYRDVLRKMTLTIILTDANIRLLIYHVRKLNERSPMLACETLDDLIRLRIKEFEKAEWIEKVLVTRLWMAIGQTDDTDSLAHLESILSLMNSTLRHPINAAAALAAHTLIWKRLESNFTQGQHDFTKKWCHVALHQIFASSGELNVARFSRKLLLCALARQDIGSAREIFSSMSETAKKEPMTQFLMYKIAVRCDEIGLASDCLQAINSSVGNDLTLLYACVLEAQQAESKVQAVAALQLVLDKHPYETLNSCHLPSLLRITIQLTMTLLNESQSDHESSTNVEKLCQLFEGAITFARKRHNAAASKEPLWTIPELDWFSKNSYNLAIEHLSTWRPRQILRMLRVCIGFIDQYPKDISEQVSNDLSLRKMFCDFSAATALVALARGEDNIEVQMQDYLGLRKHVESFDNRLQLQLDKMEEGPIQDLHRKLAVLLAFDFEAACQLKAWDDLGGIILKSDVCKSFKVYQLMADCILASQPPTQVLITNLKKIVNAACNGDAVDSLILAKYMRCLFQIALPTAPLVAEELLDKICSLAKESNATESPYPLPELEWIATRSFNHAIDLYCQNEDDASHRWALKAVMVAGFCTYEDGGALQKVLQDRLLGLRFDA